MEVSPGNQRVVDAFRAFIADEVNRAVEALEDGPSKNGWMSVSSAASYLDISEDAIRAMDKRGQLIAHRSTTGRVRFRTSDLDEHAQGITRA